MPETLVGSVTHKSSLSVHDTPQRPDASVIPEETKSGTDSTTCHQDVLSDPDLAVPSGSAPGFLFDSRQPSHSLFVTRSFLRDLVFLRNRWERKQPFALLGRPMPPASSSGVPYDTAHPLARSLLSYTSPTTGSTATAGLQPSDTSQVAAALLRRDYDCRACEHQISFTSTDLRKDFPSSMLSLHTAHYTLPASPNRGSVCLASSFPDLLLRARGNTSSGGSTPPPSSILDQRHALVFRRPNLRMGPDHLRGSRRSLGNGGPGS